MKKNYILAFVLSFAVLMSWQYFVGHGNTPVPSAAPSLSGPTPAAAPSLPTTIPLPVTRDVKRESVLVFEMGINRISINRYGGAVAQWEIREKDQWLTLVPEQKFAVQPLASFPDVSFEVRAEGDRLVLNGQRPDGLTIEKTIRVSPSAYMHEVSHRLTNTGTGPLSTTYELGWGPGVEAGDENGKNGREAKGFQRAIVFDGTKLTKLKPGTHSGTYQWWAVDGHYFLGALIRNPAEATEEITVLVEKEEHYFSIRRVIPVHLQPGESRVDTLNFFVGPKAYRDLKGMGIGLERSVDFGYFAPFGRLIHQALFILHKVTGNYGWAIILLTVIIQILVIPLTVKSFKHGQKMKAVQPQMKRLQELYKGDARRLNSEMLALYQRHGMRFMGMEGCVPMLIQLPVFWALFSTLRNTFELRYAPWMGWIRDLSAHDPYYVLPVLMGGGMFLQQKMTMSSMDPTQKQIMYMMPIIFTFVFLKMPSGLVIYWLTNSLLTIGIQYYLLRKESGLGVAK
ncbi:MAG: membrane protein insertase YidC [Elusimicrobia bacterium]|jgi:YidC/Oxa1 family membrane protein insertase|nr:membrane protein insertase YidC [Elusimicrobiota bacterium]